MIINSHIHETLFGVLARQTKVRFHVFGGINIVLGQDFVADIVDSQAVNEVKSNLLARCWAILANPDM